MAGVGKQLPFRGTVEESYAVRGGAGGVACRGWRVSVCAQICALKGRGIPVRGDVIPIGAHALPAFLPSRFFSAR